MSSIFGALGFVANVTGKAIGAAVKAIAEDDDICAEDKDEDGPNMYEQKASVDQILHFFECEYDKFAAFVEDATKLESHRVEYYNCVNAIEFQNELISQLVEEVLDLRTQLRSGNQQGATGFGSRARAAAENARKEIIVRLEHAKLDIGERRSKRRAKHREKQSIQLILSPLIGEAKLKRLLEEQASAQQTIEDVETKWKHCRSEERMSSTSRSRKSTEKEMIPNEEDTFVMSSTMEGRRSGTVSRRRMKHYSDAELSALLREKDD